MTRYCKGLERMCEVLQTGSLCSVRITVSSSLTYPFLQHTPSHSPCMVSHISLSFFLSSTILFFTLIRDCLMVLCGLKTVLRFAILMDVHVDGPFVTFLFTILIRRWFGLAPYWSGVGLAWLVVFILLRMGSSTFRGKLLDFKALSRDFIFSSKCSRSQMLTALFLRQLTTPASTVGGDVFLR